jgi:uncharacterized protein involved in type VI secretion and phage assembly
MADLIGKFRAVVVDVGDPAGRGRVRLSVPALGGEVTPWAEPCRPLTGPGTYVVPAAGSEVWVEFEGGDPERPILCGLAGPFSGNPGH